MQIMGKNDVPKIIFSKHKPKFDAEYKPYTRAKSFYSDIVF